VPGEQVGGVLAGSLSGGSPALVLKCILPPGEKTKYISQIKICCLEERIKSASYNCWRYLADALASLALPLFYYIFTIELALYSQ
jgi:hypothetical protein